MNEKCDVFGKCRFEELMLSREGQKSERDYAGLAGRISAMVFVLAVSVLVWTVIIWGTRWLWVNMP